MNVGIIVEGADDFETYPVLIRRIRGDIERVFPIECGGLRKLKNKFVSFIKDFDSRHDRNVAKVMVIRDSDCGDPRILEEELRHRLEESGFRPSFPVHFFAARCKLESWLLADEAAINSVAQARNKPGSIGRINEALERLREADELLAKTLWRVRLPADEKVYAEIAGYADLDTIAVRCPYFREFEERLRAC